MRRLFWIVMGVAALYAGLWFVAERTVEGRAAAALEGLRVQGWRVEYDGLNVTGFPSRLDAGVQGLLLVSPDGQSGVSAPDLRAYALVYRPNHVILDLPPRWMLRVAGQEVAVDSDRLRASVRAGLSRDVPLREAVVEGDGVVVSGADAGFDVGLGRLLLALREGAIQGEGENSYDLYLDASDLRPVADGPLAIDLVRIDATATLDRPLDRGAQEVPPQVVGVELREVRATRGDTVLSATGELAPDAEGFLAGQVTLVAENWRGLLDLGEEAGALGEAQRAGFEAALAGLAGGSDRIEVPVTFEGGRISALGLSLLDAPRVR